MDTHDIAIATAIVKGKGGGSGGGYTKAETDSLLNKKVDKEPGKGLSAENFTAAEKTKLAGLSNYDDTQVRADIEALEGSRYTKAETDALLSEKQDTLTTAQLAAVNSGVTAEKVAQYDDLLARSAVVYGFHIDPNESDPSEAVTYLIDAVGMTPAAMGQSAFNYGSWQDVFFMPKPCMLKYDGTVDYYLDPNDYSKKLDGTSSDVDNPNYEGNAMMEWGLIWYKFESGTVNGEGYFYVSNTRVDDTYHCWCNYDCDNNIINHFYTAIYNGTGIQKTRSLSGVQLTSSNGNGLTTGDVEIERAVANNTTDKIEWYNDILSDYQLITMLLVLIGKSTNIQAKFGRGLDTGDQSAKEAYVTGTLNDKGLFWGDTANGTSAVKVFGIENFYGCVWHRVTGMVGTDYKYKVKLTHGTIDGSTAEGFNSDGTGYIDLDIDQPSANGYIKYCTFTDYGFVPTDSTGSSTTFYADYDYRGIGSLLMGGRAGDATSLGPFYVGLHSGFAEAFWSVSTFLSCKPLARRG